MNAFYLLVLIHAWCPLCLRSLLYADRRDWWMPWMAGICQYLLIKNIYGSLSFLLSFVIFLCLACRFVMVLAMLNIMFLLKLATSDYMFGTNLGIFLTWYEEHADTVCCTCYTDQWTATICKRVADIALMKAILYKRTSKLRNLEHFKLNYPNSNPVNSIFFCGGVGWGGWKLHVRML